MSLDELIFFLAVTFFSLTVVLSASAFYYLMKRVREESYELLSAILAPINKQLLIIERGLSKAVYDIDRVTTRVEKVENDTAPKYRSKASLSIDFERITEGFTEQISQLRDTQNRLRERIEVIEKRPLMSPPRKREPASFQSPLLTKTEKKILEVLRSDGPKTAPEIENVIRKTREHTSRLMKKLWLEGYIEREMHVIPYVYRPTNKEVERVKEAY